MNPLVAKKKEIEAEEQHPYLQSGNLDIYRLPGKGMDGVNKIMTIKLQKIAKLHLEYE